jgi:hypothetical protein
MTRMSHINKSIVMHEFLHPHLAGQILLGTALTGVLFWSMHARAIGRGGAALYLALLLVAWYLVDFALVYNGLVKPAPAGEGPPTVALALAPPVLIGCALLFLRGYRRVVDAISLEWIAWFHTVRIAFGTVFLARLELGTVPELFALRGGYGDILAGLVGVVAALMLHFGAGRAPLRWVLIAFSLIGLGDLVLVLATAAMTFPPPVEGAPVDTFAMIPAFVVPQLILTHVIVIRRLIIRAV